MRLTVGQLLGAESALRTLSTLRLPVKTAYAVSKLLKLAAKELEVVNEQRNGWIAEYGVEENGQKVIKPGSEGWQSFKAKLDELVAVEVELAWTPIAFEAMADQNIAPGDLLALEPFILPPAETPAG